MESDDLKDYDNLMKRLEHRVGKKPSSNQIEERKGQEVVKQKDRAESANERQDLEDEREQDLEGQNDEQQRVETSSGVRRAREDAEQQQWSQPEVEHSEPIDPAGIIEDQGEESSEMSYDSQENEQLLEEGKALAYEKTNMDTYSLSRGLMPGTASKPPETIARHSTVLQQMKPLKLDQMDSRASYKRN